MNTTHSNYPVFKSTTILAILHNDQLAIGGDGQATMGNMVAKSNVNKIHALEHGIFTGFAGSPADAFILLDEFEKKLSEHYDMQRAAIELAKMWRTDRYLRKLEAMIILCNKQQLLIVSGTGDVLEPDDKIASIGSGSVYAYSAAKALQKFAKHLSAEEIVRESLNIAAEKCVYTNNNLVIKTA